MKKILSVLILVLTISSFSSNAEDVTIGHFLLKNPDEIPEWERTFKTRDYKSRRYTFLVIPLNIDMWLDKKAIQFLLLTAFYTMYPEATIPHEFSNFCKAGDKYPTGVGTVMLPSILLTMASQQNYWIKEVTNNYIVLTKFIYEKEQK